MHLAGDKAERPDNRTSRLVSMLEEQVLLRSGDLPFSHRVSS